MRFVPKRRGGRLAEALATQNRRVPPRRSRRAGPWLLLAARVRAIAGPRSAREGGATSDADVVGRRPSRHAGLHMRWCTPRDQAPVTTRLTARINPPPTPQRTQTIGSFRTFQPTQPMWNDGQFTALATPSVLWVVVAAFATAASRASPPL